MPKSISDKQKRFAKEYLVDLNASQAAIRAGYSKKTAGAIGFENLKKPKIHRLIEKGRQKLSLRTEVSQDNVIRELARLAFFDIRKFFNDEGELIPIADLDNDSAAVIAGMEVLEAFEGTGKERTWIGHTKKIKLTRKEKSLELLGRHLGIFEKDNAQIASSIADILNEINGSTRGLPGQKTASCNIKR